MVMFYDEYSTETFTTIVNKYLDAEFVQPMAAQIEVKQLVSKSKAIQSKMVLLHLCSHWLHKCLKFWS